MIQNLKTMLKTLWTLNRTKNVNFDMKSNEMIHVFLCSLWRLQNIYADRTIVYTSI